MTFDLQEFLEKIYEITKSTIIIFCGKEQLSEIHRFFADKQKKNKGTVRQLIWKKTNPSPMNGQHIYLSGIENAVWFKKRGGTFNARCKNTVFEYPCGRSKLHPTEKNHDLLRELILDNSNEGDIVYDPCMGSGSHLLIAKELNRKYIGNELNFKWFNVARQRMEGTKSMVKIIIAGSREFNNYKLLEKYCHKVFYELSQDEILTGHVKEDISNMQIISGTAIGADTLGERFAKNYSIELKQFPADWSLGKQAGYIRNVQMADYAVEDNAYGILIAFWDGKSKGTKHMIDIARGKGMKIKICNYTEYENEV